MRSLSASALFAIFVALSADAAPAASSSDSGSSATYTCDSDTQWHDAYQTISCTGDTVCVSGASGNPCQFPSDYGEIAVATSGSSATTTSATAGATTSADTTAVAAATTAGATTSASAALECDASVSTGEGTSAVTSADAGVSATTATTAASGGISSAASSSGASSSGASSSGASSSAASSTASSNSASGGAASSGDISTEDTGTSTASTSSASSSSTSSSSSGTRYVAYWDKQVVFTEEEDFVANNNDSYANLGGVSSEQLDSVTHVVLSFADMTDWATNQSSFAVSSSDNGNFNSTTASDLKAMSSDLKVMGALGGWGLDSVMAAEVRGGESTIETFVANAKGFVDEFDLDGIDIDWEFPSASDVDNLVIFIQKLRDSLGSDALISIALGARVNSTDVAAYTTSTFSQLDDLVDMWNVMTYDYVNRYSNFTEEQAGNRVVTTVMDYYESQGITMDKCNIGFPINAKYFTGVDTCSNDDPIGCALPGRSYYETDGEDNNKSGWLRYNSDLDTSLGTDGNEWAVKMRTQFEARPTDGSTERSEDVSNAWYDEDNQTFWTWMTPDDMTSTCTSWKGKVGGMMIWSLNHDDASTSGGTHISALASCVAGS